MKFIIWTGSFNESSGGIIALHLLCLRLNEIGETAMLWPAGRPALRGRTTLKEIGRAIRWELGRLRRLGNPNFSSGPFPNPVARSRDLEGATIVYPEVAEGNPLKGEHVVRWLLHKPGYHTQKIIYGAGDLFFHYQEAFEDPDYPSRRLTLTWVNEAYQDFGGQGRSGSSYLLRKGKGREIVHDLTHSICVDQMTHEERVAVFNPTEYFYCYDLYTMYASYAAACGCIPIVVPVPGLSKEQWVPDERDRYGIAYGADDIPWAIASRESLLARMRQVQEEQDVLVRDFIRVCRERFFS